MKPREGMEKVRFRPENSIAKTDSSVVSERTIDDTVSGRDWHSQEPSGLCGERRSAMRCVEAETMMKAKAEFHNVVKSEK